MTTLGTLVHLSFLGLNQKEMECKNLILAFLIIVTIGCNIFDESPNELIGEYYNPSQNLKVIVFKKLGNSTTTNSLQLILNTNDFNLKNSDNGNIFIADNIEALNNINGNLIVVNWISNNSVEINYPVFFRIFKMEEMLETNIGKVAIKYNARQ